MQRSFGNNITTSKDLCSGTRISMHCTCSTEELFKTNGLALGLQNQRKTTSSISAIHFSLDQRMVAVRKTIEH